MQPPKIPLFSCATADTAPTLSNLDCIFSAHTMIPVSWLTAEWLSLVMKPKRSSSILLSDVCFLLFRLLLLLLLVYLFVCVYGIVLYDVHVYMSERVQGWVL